MLANALLTPCTSKSVTSTIELTGLVCPSCLHSEQTLGKFYNKNNITGYTYTIGTLKPL